MTLASRKVVFLCVAVLLAGVSRGSAQTKTMADDLREEWEAERKAFGDIARAMPADK